MTLFLFDIDGTLLQANGVGRKAISDALSSLTDRSVSADGVPFSGRTDQAIMADVLEQNGVAPTEANVDAALSAYINAMHSALSPSAVDVLPGVRPLLETLHDRPEVHLGLVTGNVEPIAYEKLRMHDLDEYFPVGAFGSDHAERNRLPPLATRRAAEHTGRAFHAAEHAVVIGDTVHDIECARATGARAVAVCTGYYGPEALSEGEPDVLFDSLPSPETFIRRLPGTASTASS